MTDEQDNAGVVAPPPLIYAGPLLLGLLLNRKFEVPFLPRGVARILGWSLLAGGALLVSWFARTMRRADTPMDPREPVSRLVTAGPFRYTRNPAYLGLTMMYAGLSSLANALPSILLLPAVLLVMQRGVIEREERYLEGKFDEEYLLYKARVRRWI
ncbi:MAG: isoprenylcysteine carboxylmethyltransferase family protein [Actinomycetota bacterium]|nr:isoprenylcysteine carboxylmethyltransferase family protein [Actinomycetota bacterium]